MGCVSDTEQYRADLLIRLDKHIVNNGMRKVESNIGIIEYMQFFLLLEVAKLEVQYYNDYDKSIFVKRQFYRHYYTSKYIIAVKRPIVVVIMTVDHVKGLLRVLALLSRSGRLQE